jgi:hypothetical protein
LRVFEKPDFAIFAIIWLPRHTEPEAQNFVNLRHRNLLSCPKIFPTACQDSGEVSPKTFADDREVAGNPQTVI